MKEYFLLLLLVSCTTAAQKGKTLLAVFAHPDDEQTVGPVLAKYASEGAQVYLMIATDGRYGVAPHAHIPAGDTLAAVRSEEAKCAAEKLGINTPIFIGMPDQLDMANGYTAIYASMDSIKRAVTNAFIKLQPDVVITWGQSGWTGHADHRIVGDIVSEVLLSQQWDKHPKLYYGELPSFLKDSLGFGLAKTDPQYLTVKISLSAQDLAKSNASWHCHKSQYTPEQVEKFYQALWAKNKPVAYFRPLVEDGKMKTSLF